MFNRNVVTLLCLLTIFSFCSPAWAIISSEREGRILGGVAATTTHLNRVSVASVRLYNIQGSYHVCGGFIINRRWVGTAAQCMSGKTINNALVAVGSLSIAGGTLYNLDRIVQHENYDEAYLVNDVAVLRTNRDIVFGTAVQAIRVAGEMLQVGRLITIFGWGRTTPTSNFPDNLMTAEFTTIDLGTCLSRFPSVSRPYITDQHICTSFATRATCPGDAGGPLVVDNAVVGIASWVEPCVAGQTNVNVRMSSYANWILNHTRFDDKSSFI